MKSRVEVRRRFSSVGTLEQVELCGVPEPSLVSSLPRRTDQLSVSGGNLTNRSGFSTREQQQRGTPMKTILTTTLAVAMLAGSSFAFAADNSNSGGGNKTTMGQETTGSVNSGTDSPDQAEIERCKTAPADDVKCAGLPKN